MSFAGTTGSRFSINRASALELHDLIYGSGSDLSLANSRHARAALDKLYEPDAGMHLVAFDRCCMMTSFAHGYLPLTSVLQPATYCEQWRYNQGHTLLASPVHSRLCPYTILLTWSILEEGRQP